MTKHTGTNIYDMERTGSRLDLPITGDASLSRRTSRRDTSGINAGYAIRNASRWCHTSPDLESVLNFSDVRS